MPRSRDEISTPRLLLAAVPLALIVLAAEGQQNPGGFSASFTGGVEILDSAEMRSSRIRFEAGARTNWHTVTDDEYLGR